MQRSQAARPCKRTWDSSQRRRPHWQEVNRQKGINFQYVKQSGSTAKTVTLSAEPASGQSFSKDSTLVEYGERKLYYSTIQANSISWIDGDVYYMLMDINKAVTKDELTAMAKEIIDLDMTSAQ